jgi:hypothetical protein
MDASLGKLEQAAIDAWWPNPGNNQGPGEITMTFDIHHLRRGRRRVRADIRGARLCEGVHQRHGLCAFDSLTPGSVSGYGTVDPTDVYNLVSKHVNSYGRSWGTLFDLETLADNPLALYGLVDIDNINYVKIIDVSLLRRYLRRFLCFARQLNENKIR